MILLQILSPKLPERCFQGNHITALENPVGLSCTYVTNFKALAVSPREPVTPCIEPLKIIYGSLQYVTEP